MKVYITSFIFLLALTGLDVQASLKLDALETTSVTGLEAVNVVLTIQRESEEKGPESGCVAWDGDKDVLGDAACPNSGLSGGDEQTGDTPTKTRTLSELGVLSAANLRVVFNPQKTDPAPDLVLEQLILTIFDTDGGVCFNSGAFTPVTFEGAATGNGKKGLVFRLDERQAAQAQPCFADLDRRVGLAAQAAGATRGGLETFFVAEVSDVKGPVADLALQKDDAVYLAPTESSLTYTLTVTNNGPDNAASVVLSDSMPSSVTFDSATPDQGGCSACNGFVECQLGKLATGDSTTVEIKVTTGSSDQTITNTASVVSELSDPDRSNNTVTEQAVVGVEAAERADLSIVKNASRDPVAVGETLTYSLSVSNDGPDTAASVVVNDRLPDGLTEISARSTAGECSVLDQTVTCELGDLPGETTETVSIDGRPVEIRTLQNTATVGSDTPDPDTANNSGNEETKVALEPVLSADLELTKVAETEPVALGGEVQYTLTVANDGPDTAVAVVVTDQAPDRLGDLAASTADGNCAVSVQTISCQMDDIAAGSSERITVTGTAPQANTRITNSATAESETSDRNTANNSASARITVGAGTDDRADVAVIMEDSPDPIEIERQVVYLVTASNVGPEAATDVEVSSLVSPGLTVDDVSPSMGSCSVSENDVTCRLDRLDTGASEYIEITATALEPGTVLSSASISAQQPDPQPDNNAASEPTRILVRRE